MAITLTNPIPRPTTTTVRLQSFTINAELRYAEAIFVQGHFANGEFVTTAIKRVTFQDNSTIADFSFTQLVNNISAVRTLRDELEAGAVALGIFTGTLS